MTYPLPRSTLFPYTTLFRSFRRRVQRMTGHRASDVAKERVMREVIIPETITIQELANRMTERGVDVIRLLMKQRSEEHTSELQSRLHLVCRLLLEKKN